MKIKKKRLALDLKIIKAGSDYPARLQITDHASGLDFVLVDLDPGALESLLYGNPITSRSEVSAIGKQLGLQRIVESRTVPYFGSLGDDQKTIENWILVNKQEPGWFVDPHVRPADIHLLGGQLHITYHVFRFA